MKSITFQNNGTKIKFEKVNDDNDVKINIGDFFEHISENGFISCEMNITNDGVVNNVLIHSASSKLITDEKTLKKIAGFLITEIELYNLKSHDDINF